MKKTWQLAVGTAAVAALLSTSAFADGRSRDWTDQNRGGDRNQGEWRDSRNGDQGRYDQGRNDRDRNRSLSIQGKVSRIERESDGYRVQLDRRGEWFHVPETMFRSARGGRYRGSDLRVGVSIRLGGIWEPRYGYYEANDFGWVDDGYGYAPAYGSDARYLTGIVDRVDYRRNVAFVSVRGGRYVEVAMDGGYGRRLRIDDLRRGDEVTFEGDWLRGGVFEAFRIDGINGRRW